MKSVLLRYKVKRALCNRIEILLQRHNVHRLIIEMNVVVNRSLPSELEVIVKARGPRVV